MNLILLDLPLKGSIHWGMMKTQQKTDKFSLTSTQIGAIGEAIVAAELTLASGGRLAPFKPFADDDGIDLLIYDKMTKRALPIQIKSRTKVDNEKAQTVQFDVQKTTFTDQGDTHLTAVLMNGTELICSWLIPMSDLAKTARAGARKFSIVPSAKEASKDKYTPYRHHTFDDVANSLICRLSN